MEIHPTDLGEGFAQEIIVRRTRNIVTPVKAGFFRSFFWRSTKLPYSKVDAILMQATKLPTLRQIAFFLIWHVSATIVGIRISEHFHPGPGASDPSRLPLIGVPLPQFLFVLAFSGICMTLSDTFGVRKQFVAPVTEYEAYEMRQVFDSPPQAATVYAYLVQEIAAAKNIAPSAQPALRDALRLIGEAVYALSTAPVRQWNNHDNYPVWSHQALESAHAESDHVVKEALLRKAESYRQAFAAAEQNAFVKRRVDAQLDALVAQIAALRVALPTFAEDYANVASISQLSEKARSVADEVTAQFNAHRELDEAMTISVGHRS